MSFTSQIYQFSVTQVSTFPVLMAYIDPNAAGLLSQIITPLLITAAAAFAFLRKQIGAALSSVARMFHRHPQPESAEPPTSPAE